MVKITRVYHFTNNELENILPIIGKIDDVTNGREDYNNKDSPITTRVTTITEKEEDVK